MGMLVVNENDDLLDPKSWKKLEKPVFKTSYKINNMVQVIIVLQFQKME